MTDTKKRTFGLCKTTNPAVLDWVKEQAKLCQPKAIFWCEGSEEEKELLTLEAVRCGVLLKLNQEKLPGCYYHRSNPNDVARTESCTYVCAENKDLAGPTNNWAPPRQMYEKLHGLLSGSMRDRTMYVIPYLMGVPASPLARVGFELTDSLYVVLSMRIMTRMGQIAYEHLGQSDDFNRGLHCTLDLDPQHRYICHFPQDNTIISVGSAYGGNALLGKKSLALRIGSYLAREAGWMAEHMLVLGVESPTGEKTFVAAAFPSACGKTNFAMMTPSPRFAGWKIRTVGDDIAWMKPGLDGRLYAINPEAGYFGVMPGTNFLSNPNAMRIIQRDTIYTNVALTPDLDVWWEGKDGESPRECLDWRGDKWTPDCGRKAAHPNSRFAAPMANNPNLAPEVNNPEGVPISAIIFGGRRTHTMPLVYQSFNWIHGVYMGATMTSETTAAATEATGELRYDPMAMLPFCGYHMGDYFGHWIAMRKAMRHPPRIFHVNWFRRDDNGDLLWPGFGENMRVLKWIVDRCWDRAGGEETPFGWVPSAESFDLEDLPNHSVANFRKLQSMAASDWRKELLQQKKFFEKMNPRLPAEMVHQRELLLAQL